MSRERAAGAVGPPRANRWPTETANAHDSSITEGAVKLPAPCPWSPLRGPHLGLYDPRRERFTCERCILVLTRSGYEGLAGALHELAELRRLLGDELVEPPPDPRVALLSWLLDAYLADDGERGAAIRRALRRSAALGPEWVARWCGPAEEVPS